MSADGLLDTVAAASRLAVSPELLFHYATKGARSVVGAFRLSIPRR